MGKKAAVACSTGIGDGLLYSIISNNLRRNGYEVTTYSNALMSLQPWIESHRICPFPKEGGWQEELKGYDLVVVQDCSLCWKERPLLPQAMRVSNRSFDPNKPLVANLVDLCQKLGLEGVTAENGVVAPSHLRHRYFGKRVLIHPMSTTESKNWSAKKFIRLGHRLKKMGWEPVIVVSPEERPFWQEQGLSCPLFPTLIDLASFVYESAYEIGNDSSVGHLASYFGLPTVTLFGRKARSVLWRPGWTPGRVVIPLPVVPFRSLRLRFWKPFLLQSQVLYHFRKLLKEEAHTY